MALFSIGYGLLLASRWCEYFKGACSGRTKFTLKDDSLYWLNLGIGRVCLFQVDNTWKSETGIAGESSGSPKLRHKEHANSRKVMKIIVLGYWTMFMIYVMFFFHAVGITLKFKKIPLKTRIWAHTIGLNPRERPWTLKSVNLERSNLQVDSMCCFRGHQIIYIYISAQFLVGGNRTMQMYGNF